MKKLMTTLSILTLFAGALFLGYASPASANDDLANADAAQPLNLEISSLDEGPGPGRRARRARRGAHALAKACPCVGPDGPDGEAWGSHDAWLECVTDALAQAVADGKLDQEKADKILERATASSVGDPEHECRKPRRERGERPGKPGEPEDPELF